MLKESSIDTPCYRWDSKVFLHFETIGIFDILEILEAIVGSTLEEKVILDCFVTPLSSIAVRGRHTKQKTINPALVSQFQTYFMKT